MGTTGNETLTRNDVHRPSTIDPKEYEYVAQEVIKVEGIETCMTLQAEREKIREHMKSTGGNYSGHQHGGNCMVCGSVNAIYTTLFYHAKTNSYVRMGQDCAVKCDLGNAEDFRSFRAGIKDARELHTGKAKAQAVLTDAGLERAWAIHETTVASSAPLCEQVDIAGRPVPLDVPFEERTISDIAGKLIRYGSISDKQMEFVGKLLERIDTRADRARRQAKEQANAKPCPSGRIEITGTVLTTKYQESAYGETLKMLVKADDGWKVWGTVPSVLEIFTDGETQRGLQHGDRVRFKAQVTPSNTDTKFGFFKRPTQAEVIS